MDRNNHGASDLENPHTPLKNSMTKELESLPLLSSACSIGRVPKRQRNVKEEAYTPKVVSIGPLHHGREDLKPMEEHKKRYLNNFIHQTNVSLGSYIEVIKQKEARLRDCYAETIQFNSDEFVKIILVDVAFIIEVILKLNFPDLVDEVDHIFKKPWLLTDLVPDMLLLENQVPFFILEDLVNHGNVPVPSHDGERPSIIKLAHQLFKFVDLGGAEDNLEKINSSKVEHLLDLLRLFYMPLKQQQPEDLSTNSDLAPNATELHQAGVKFRVQLNSDLFDLQFNKGTLKIPELRLNKRTELAIRNLVAFEQCYCDKFYISSYIIFLDSLVNSKEDVDLLVKNRILRSYTSDNSAVADFIDKLPSGILVPFHEFYFATLCEDLRAHYRNSWHNWKANLRQNYFNTPWTIISFIAGIAFLILTLIQTVCSLISITSSNSNGYQH